MKRASRPCWRFRRRARAAMVEIGSAGVSSMKSGQFSSAFAASMKRRISSSVMSPWRIWCEGTREASERMRAASCSDGHLEREEADDAALDRALGAVGPGALLVGAGDVEGDVGGERGLAHRRAAGEDQEVGGVQAAEALVEVDEAGGEAGEAAVALVGGVRDLDRVDDGAAEGLEAAVDLALLAELVERLLGLDDLVLGLAVDLDARRLLGDVLADHDQLAADGEVVDELGVVAGGEERDRGAGEADEVGGAAELLEAGVLLEEGLDGDRGGQRVAADALGGDLEDAGVHRVEEVRRLHDAGDPVVDVVVDEERAEQRLLGLDVVRQALRGSASSAAVVPSAMSLSLRRAVIAGPRARASPRTACG